MPSELAFLLARLTVHFLPIIVIQLLTSGVGEPQLVVVRIFGVKAIFTVCFGFEHFLTQLCQIIQEQSFKETKSSFRTCIDQD